MRSPARVSDLLTAEEIRALSRRSDWRGAFAVASTWGVIALAFLAMAWCPHPLVWLAGVIVLGGRQLALAILMHEAAHRSLFRTRWLNDTLTDWLCARVIWQDLTRYREHHLRHHGHTGTELDPDISLVQGLPTTRAGLARKLLRDLTGLTGLKRLVGLLLMDLGVLEYTVASAARRRPRAGRTTRHYLAEGARNLAGFALTQALLLAVLAAAGHPGLYLAWWVAYLIPFSVFIRIRSLAEHACTLSSPHTFENTRTTRAGWLARGTVAPLRVNYHLEHHFLAGVPYYRLPALHRLLRERAGLPEPPGYLEVLRLVASARAPAA